jgi:hypothetical protein
MTLRIQRRGLVAASLVSIVLSGCVQTGPPTSGERVTDRERTQAQEALARWAAAVEAGGGTQGFVPVGELTAQVGDWEEEVGGNNKSALYAGMVQAAVALPTELPGKAAVRWDDDRTMAVAPISAQQALQALVVAGDKSCPTCVPLRVTRARLSTTKVLTSRGPATTPAWEFTLKDTKVLVTRIAIAASDAIIVTPPPWDPNASLLGTRIEGATRTADGRQLTVAFTGAPEGRDRPCGADYSAEAVESDTAIVVIVVTHPNGAAVACRMVGATRTARADLAGPLGERTLLEITPGTARLDRPCALRPTRVDGAGGRNQMPEGTVVFGSAPRVQAPASPELRSFDPFGQD